MRFHKRLYEYEKKKPKLPEEVKRVFPFLTDDSMIDLEPFLVFKIGKNHFFTRLDGDVGIQAFNYITPCKSASPKDILAKLAEVESFSRLSLSDYHTEGGEVLYFSPGVESATIHIEESNITKTIIGEGLTHILIYTNDKKTKNVKVIVPKEVEIIFVGGAAPKQGFNLDLSECRSKRFFDGFWHNVDYSEIELPPGKKFEIGDPDMIEFPEGEKIPQIANEKAILEKQKAAKIAEIKRAGDLALLSAINEELEWIASIEINKRWNVFSLRSERLPVEKCYLFNCKMKDLRQVYLDIKEFKEKGESSGVVISVDDVMDIFIANGEIEPTLDLKGFLMYGGFRYTDATNGKIKYIIPGSVEKITTDDFNEADKLKRFFDRAHLEYPTEAVID